MDAVDRVGSRESTYVEAARRGGHSWWKYLLGLGVILFSWLVVGSVLSIVVTLVMVALGPGLTSVTESLASDSSFRSVLGPVGEYLVLHVSFLGLLAGVVVAVALIHRRHPRTLVTARSRINLRRIGQGFVAWLVPWVLVIGFGQFLIYPSSFSLGSNLFTLVYFVPLALVFTSIQVMAEELLFRGYLVQGTSLIWANRIFLALVAATLFTLPHLFNPEASSGGFLTVFLNYFVAGGLVWVVVSLLDGTTELAIGAHLANNLCNALLVNSAGTALSTPALFSVGEFNAIFYSLSVLVVVPVFFVIAFRFFGSKPAPLYPQDVQEGQEGQNVQEEGRTRSAR